MSPKVSTSSKTTTKTTSKTTSTKPASTTTTAIPISNNPVYFARPETAIYWCNSSIWQLINQTGVIPAGWNGGVNLQPTDGSNVLIPVGFYVVVDCVLPKLNRFRIDGAVEFSNGRDHYLEVSAIVIMGGQLIIGWENDPILTNVVVNLTGTATTIDRFDISNGFDIVKGKGIGVNFG